LEGKYGSNQRSSPNKSTLTQWGKTTSSLSTKSFDKKLDSSWGLIKKLEDRSSPRRTPSKDLTILSSLERKLTSQNSLVSPGYRNSYSKRDKSPRKEYSTLESGTFEYRKTPQASKSSFLDDRERSVNRTPNIMKESLIKILDGNTTPKKDSEGRRDLERSSRGLSQQINNLRSSRLTLQPQSPEKREEPTAMQLRYSSDNLKTLSSFVTESFKNKERERDEGKYSTKKLSLYNGAVESKKSLLEGSSLASKVPLSRLYEMQDTFHNASDREFNSLSSEYVEELIKLSSVIMQRVKGSAYYTRE